MSFAKLIAPMPARLRHVPAEFAEGMASPPIRDYFMDALELGERAARHLVTGRIPEDRSAQLLREQLHLSAALHERTDQGIVTHTGPFHYRASVIKHHADRHTLSTLTSWKE